LVTMDKRLQGERRRRRLAVALATAVVLLVIIAASAWVRRAETEAAVHLALQNAERLRSAAESTVLTTPEDAHIALLKWQQCEAAVKEAETALAVGAADATLQRSVSQWRKTVQSGIRSAQQQRLELLSRGK
jgi:hypothetical protein